MHKHRCSSCPFLPPLVSSGDPSQPGFPHRLIASRGESRWVSLWMHAGRQRKQTVGRCDVTGGWNHRARRCCHPPTQCTGTANSERMRVGCGTWACLAGQCLCPRRPRRPGCEAQRWASHFQHNEHILFLGWANWIKLKGAKVWNNSVIVKETLSM